MPYDGQEKKYTHLPYGVPLGVIDSSRELYRLSPTHHVTDTVARTILNASEYAVPHQKGSANTWAQILRLSNFTLKDSKVIRGKASLFRHAIELLAEHEVHDEGLFIDIVTELTEPDECLAIVTDAVSLHLKAHKNRSDIHETPLIPLGYHDLSLVTGQDDASWGIYRENERVSDVLVRSFATALVSEHVELLQESLQA